MLVFYNQPDPYAFECCDFVDVGRNGVYICIIRRLICVLPSLGFETRSVELKNKKSGVLYPK